LFIVLLVLMVAADTRAALMSTGVGAADNTNSGPPPTCTNVLDFTQACNSQYVGVF
jgi:hypothetical protein